VPIKPIAFTLTGILFSNIVGCQGPVEHATTYSASMGALGSVNGPAAVERREMNAGRSDRLSIMTFNMQHRNNPDELEVVADHLQSDLDETPDFILCQEVLFERSHNPEEANTAALLANDLDCYWHGTKRTSDREGVAIISRYPFTYYAERHLKSQTSRLLLGFRRVSVMGEFQVPGTGLVRVTNIHLTNWGFEEHVRRKQLEETLEWMADREREVHADVNILGGDFNIKSGSDELKIVTEGKYAQLFNFQNCNTGLPTRGGKGHPSYRVDYIFISSPNKQLQLTQQGEQRLFLQGLTSPTHKSRFWPSDHVPVVQEFASGKSVKPVTVASIAD
jgi:endonuclease/exonuclease/phosphatase family metal-dependent hydrolase